MIHDANIFIVVYTLFLYTLKNILLLKNKRGIKIMNDLEIKNYIEMKATNSQELEEVIKSWIKRVFDKIDIRELPVKLTEINSGVRKEGIYFMAMVSNDVLLVPCSINAVDSIEIGRFLPKIITPLLREYLYGRTGENTPIFGCTTMNFTGILKQALEEMR